MPIKGVILIFIVAVVVAVINKDQIYTWLKIAFRDDDKDSDENEEDLK